MISPLGQRQILQTLAVETVRLAMEGATLVQREQARKLAFDAKLQEAMNEVPDVGETDELRLSDSKDEARKGWQGTGASDEAESEPEGQAEGAGPHLDLLA